jgi:aspartokinase
MSRLVMKFGGTSLADVGAHPARGGNPWQRRRAQPPVAVVVSAMAGPHQ